MNKDYLEFCQTIPQIKTLLRALNTQRSFFGSTATHSTFGSHNPKQTRGREICLWYVYKLRGKKRYYVKWIKLKWLTLLFVASPRTKDVEWRPYLTNTHTYTSFSSSCHKHLSPQISVCDPHSTVSLPFLSSSGYQPASRRKQHPSRAASYTSPRTFSRQHPISQWIFKNIHIYTTRITQRWSSILLTRFQQSLLAERGRWKEIFFPDSKLEKPSAGD